MGTANSLLSERKRRDSVVRIIRLASGWNNFRTSIPPDFCLQLDQMGNILSVNLSCDTLPLLCWDFACGDLRFVRQLDDNIAALEMEKRKLAEMQNDVKREVTSREQKGKQRLERIQGWLSRGEALSTEVDALLSLAEQRSGGCLSKKCRSSIKFGKLIAQKLQDVVELMEEGLNFNRVAASPPIPVVRKRPVDSTVGLETVLDKVCGCIREERVGLVGLYGIGGVGKTTLLKKINNRFASSPHHFNVFIWVAVSKNFVLHKVQEQIWRQIRSSDEQWKSKSAEDRAADIYNVLCGKKFLLLLDDIWKQVDLVEMGIPAKQEGSKIIFTTRSMAVCSQMGAQEKIRVESLQWEEAWALFQEKVGPHTLTSDHRIPPLAERVAKRCGGLPIALITVGRAMAGNKTWQAWEHAVEVLTKTASSLQGMDDEELFQDMENEVLGLLKFSYDSLPNDRVKSSFLYCALFPEDYKILKDALIDLWVCETFWGVYDDWTKARNKGYHILDFLISSCLLEEEGRWVKMHDVTRNMALWLSRKSEEPKNEVLVLAGAELTEAPEAKKWNGITRMSLMDNSISMVTEVPTCPDILTLFLQHNPLETLPDGFFQSMKGLTVLDLSRTNLQKCPTGFSALLSIQHLNLSRTNILELPLELQLLENLKCLDLAFCFRLGVVPRQVIFGLSSLKALKINHCNHPMFVVKGDTLEQAEDNVFVAHDVHVEVFQHLQRLSELSVSVRSPSALEIIFSSDKLSKNVHALSIETLDCPIDISHLATVEHLEKLMFEYSSAEELTVCYPTRWRGSQAPAGPPIIATACFNSLREITFYSCSVLQHLTWVILVPNLRILIIKDCNSLREVISEDKLDGVADAPHNLHPFAKLEVLHLWNLVELESIYWNPLPFPFLKEMIVSKCPTLKKLPLNLNSAKGSSFKIKGSQIWWQRVEWEDNVTKDVFQHSFKSI